MTTPHPAIAAVPADGTPNRGLIQALLVQGVIYPLASGADPEQFDPRSGDLGAVVPVLFWQGALFERDPADSTTAHDGVSVLVTADESRYKRIGDDLLFQFSVLSRSVTAVPGTPDDDPADGDAYLVPAGAAAPWDDKQDYIAIWTTRDEWTYVGPRDSRLIRIRDEDLFVHWNGDLGEWVEGFGNNALTPGSVRHAHLTNIVGFWIVENQTTDAPPASPAKGDNYIIGPTPTGSWTGHSGKIAACEDDTETFTIVTPLEGYRAYDLALGIDVRWNGASWEPANAAILQHTSVKNAASDNDTIPSGSTAYSYSSGTAPTTAAAHWRDNVSLTIAALPAGGRLTFQYRADIDLGAAGLTAGDLVLMLLRDSEATAIDWCRAPIPAGFDVGAGAAPVHVEALFEIDAGDTASHTYKVALVGVTAGVGGTDKPLVTRRVFHVQESAAL